MDADASDDDDEESQSESNNVGRSSRSKSGKRSIKSGVKSGGRITVQKAAAKPSAAETKQEFEAHPKAHSVRGRHLKQITHVRRNQESFKADAKTEWDSPINVTIGGKNIEVKSPQAAYDALKQLDRPEKILSAAELCKREDVRRKLRKQLQLFQNSRKRSHEKRTKNVRLWKCWSSMAALEGHLAMEAGVASIDSPPTVDQRDGWCESCKTHHILNTYGQPLKHHRFCPKAMKPTRVIMFEGKEGRGVGSPFGGHVNWGGNKLSKLTALRMVNMQTAEHGSSCNCSYCGHRVVKANRSVVRDGKIVSIQVNGTLECRNPECPAFQNGHALKKRDGESGKFIDCMADADCMVDNLMIISGISRALSPDNLPFMPFQPARIGGQTNNTSSILEQLAKILGKSKDDSIRVPHGRQKI